jgi:hypothetical protein
MTPSMTHCMLASARLLQPLQRCAQHLQRRGLEARHPRAGVLDSTAGPARLGSSARLERARRQTWMPDQKSQRDLQALKVFVTDAQ